MKFEDYMQLAWSEHAAKPAETADSIETGLQLIDTSAQIPPLANLVAHVFGEHLGQWQAGIDTLKRLLRALKAEPARDDLACVERLIASLELASGKRRYVDDMSISDQIRVLSVTACALTGQNQTKKAAQFFEQALELAASGLRANDAANRALAIAANNLACALEEKANRTGQETTLMILAAKTARKFWQIAGTWLEVARAEYRLARTHLQANDAKRSLEHAQKCLAQNQKYAAPALEFFFAHEIVALAAAARGEMQTFTDAVTNAHGYYEQLVEAEKNSCRKALEHLENCKQSEFINRALAK